MLKFSYMQTLVALSTRQDVANDHRIHQQRGLILPYAGLNGKIILADVVNIVGATQKQGHFGNDVQKYQETESFAKLRVKSL